ncbi:MAG TPA: response regulator transcription factor [Polyangiaceae bacterium]|nr:response regulator transcription factor [Polyangiaceae bacterium]
MTRILCVEDDRASGAALVSMLNQRGWCAAHSDSSERALHALRTTNCAMALIDWSSSTAHGIEFCKQARDAGTSAGLILVGKNPPSRDRVSALEAGADDCIAEPFDADELCARMRAVLRRRGPWQGDSSPGKVSYGQIGAHIGRGIGTIGARAVDLTRMEERLLVRLLRAQGRVVTNKELWEEFRLRCEPQLPNIRAHIASIRKKLRGHGPVIITDRGNGYRMHEEKMAILGSSS